MKVKDATDYITSEEFLVARELSRYDNDFSKSIDVQFRVYNEIKKNKSSDDVFLKEANRDVISEGILMLSRVRNSYGIRDSQKYSGKTQRWEGFIMRIEGDVFTARLEDLTNPGGTVETLEFGPDDVSLEDRDLLEVGATFYYSIGYTTISGTREKTSLLRFKRIADWTQDEYNNAIDRASRLNSSLKWD